MFARMLFVILEWIYNVLSEIISLLIIYNYNMNIIFNILWYYIIIYYNFIIFFNLFHVNLAFVRFFVCLLIL